MIDLEVGNYRGSLHVKHENNKYFWAVECDMDNLDDWEWEEIPKKLYVELISFQKQKK